MFCSDSWRVEEQSAQYLMCWYIPEIQTKIFPKEIELVMCHRDEVLEPTMTKVAVC